MPSYRVKELIVNTERHGSDGFTKASFPIRFGQYSEIKTPQYEFHFNLRGQIKFIRGLGPGWRHPGELLKRTDGNDWVYYSLGSIGERIRTWLGEYYLPCPTYQTNLMYDYNPFADPIVMSALGAWAQLYADIHQMDRGGLPDQVKEFFDLIRRNDDGVLFKEAKRLHAIIGQGLSVLPPDTRHVDYEVLPLTLADGCRYHCGFCCVKSPQAYRARSPENILAQIDQLKEWCGPDLGNYKALFLGNHDALGVDGDLLLSSARQAIKSLEIKAPVLYLFGSVDSLLAVDDQLLSELDQAAERTYINIGLESAHTPTLASIRKPLDASQVREAFQKALHINTKYNNLEISANFLLGEDLPPEHCQSVIDLLQTIPESSPRKGAIYLSPLLSSRNKRGLLKQYFEMKEKSRLPAYIYLIQRL